MQLPITNVVTVSVSAASLGANEYNTSNLAIFTYETAAGSFGILGYKEYNEPTDVATDFGTGSKTYQMALAIFSQQPNILTGGGQLIVILFDSPTETLGEAVTRTAGLVQYFGVMQSDTVTTQTDATVLAAAAVIQALNKIALFVTYVEADIQPGGVIDELRTGSFTQSRGLYYGDSSSAGLNAILMMAAYGGRAFSTDFSGSNTTQNLHLKVLATIQPDPTMTQTILGEAQDAGADCYVSLQGTPAIFESGANAFFDQIYNLRWFVGALQIAGFNYLAQASTKVPQTENGMLGLKGAYRVICEQARTNAYAAPGQWNSPTVFGNPGDLFANIAQIGFYIYSTPVNQQSQANRAARIAPLVQIALKEAGAINSSNVLVNINP